MGRKELAPEPMRMHGSKSKVARPHARSRLLGCRMLGFSAPPPRMHGRKVARPPAGCSLPGAARMLVLEPCGSTAARPAAASLGTQGCLAQRPWDEGRRRPDSSRMQLTGAARCFAPSPAAAR
eukprot:gene13009-3511_t